MAADIATLSIRVDSIDVKNATKEVNKLTSAGMDLEGLLRKIAAAWASWQVAKHVSDMTQLAARYETLGVVMGVIGNNAGYTRQQMAGFQSELEKTGISMMGARDSLNMMAAAQLDLAQSSKLARVAQDAAVIGGINSTEAFQRLVVGITSGQTEVLRNMGIIVSFESAYQKATAKAGRELTETEKLQIRFNMVLGEGAKRAGVYAASLETAGKQMLSSTRYLENLQVKVGDVFMPAYRVLVTEYTKALKDADQWMNSNAGTVATLGNAMRDFVLQVNQGLTALKQMAGGGEGVVTLVDGLTFGFKVWSTQIQAVTNGLKIMVSGAMAAISSMARAAAVVSPFAAILEKIANFASKGASNAWGGGLVGLAKGADAPMATISSHASPEERAAIEAANAAKERQKALDAQDAQMRALAGQRKSMVDALREEAATYGMTKDQILQYNAARLGLAGSKALADVLAIHKIRREDIYLAQQEVDAILSVRNAQQMAFEDNQRMLEAEAAANELALNTVMPYRQELMALGQTYEALAVALDNGTISQQQFQTAEDELLRKTQQSLPVMTEMFGDLKDTIQDWSRSSTEAFLDLAFKGKASFTDLINSMLRDLARLAIQKNVTGPLFNYLGMAISGGLSGGATTTASTTGFIDTAPVVARAMQSSGRVEPTINISINSNGTTDTKATGEGAAELGRMVNAVCDQWAVKNMRAGGLLARA